MRFDYTTIGHVTADILADGTRRPGGSAFYSALQASRLGRRTLIVTQGSVREIEELLDRYRSEFDLVIHAAPETTTLETSALGTERVQRVLAWAGPIAENLAVDTEILHFAPVARETPRRFNGRADLVGLTPQGLVRTWEPEGGKVDHVALEPAELPERFDAVVISEAERASCEWLVSDPAGAVVAVTNAAAPTAIHQRAAPTAWIQVPEIEDFRDDVGAGDVFAAAFFVAIAEGQPAADAARFANAAAAVRIGAAGADAIGRRPAIEARLRALAR